MSNIVVINRKLREALGDCAGYPDVDRGTYVWKPKSMEKLADLGLVRRIPAHRNYTQQHRGKVAYAPTEAGRDALKS